MAQNYFRLEVLGQLSGITEAIEAIPVPETASTLYDAAMARVLTADPATAQQGAELAAQTVTRLLERGPALEYDSIAMLATALAHHPDMKLRFQVASSLAPLRQGGLVVGVGLGLVPSIDYLCLLLEDSSQSGRRRALETAIVHCDRSGFLIWSVGYRLALSRLTGSRQPEDEAKALAEPTELGELITSASL
jgi:hypothetical protein